MGVGICNAIAVCAPVVMGVEEVGTGAACDSAEEILYAEERAGGSGLMQWEYGRSKYTVNKITTFDGTTKVYCTGGPTFITDLVQ